MAQEIMFNPPAGFRALDEKESAEFQRLSTLAQLANERVARYKAEAEVARGRASTFAKELVHIQQESTVFFSSLGIANEDDVLLRDGRVYVRIQKIKMEETVTNKDNGRIAL
jgi:hypothetical protein